MPTEAAGADGGALDATVTNVGPPVEERITLQEEAKMAVVAADRAVEKAKDQLDAAQDAAKAARKALKELD